MNEARLLALPYRASPVRKSLSECRRLCPRSAAGRALSGARRPDNGPRPYPRCSCPDVRRTTLTIRAFHEPPRHCWVWTSLRRRAASFHRSKEPVRNRRPNGLMTPVAGKDFSPKRFLPMPFRPSRLWRHGYIQPSKHRRSCATRRIAMNFIEAQRIRRRAVRAQLCRRPTAAARDGVSLWRSRRFLPRTQLGDGRMKPFVAPFCRPGLGHLQHATTWLIRMRMAQAGTTAGDRRHRPTHLFLPGTLGEIWAKMRKCPPTTRLRAVARPPKLSTKLVVGDRPLLHGAGLPATSDTSVARPRWNWNHHGLAAEAFLRVQISPSKLHSQ